MIRAFAKLLYICLVSGLIFNSFPQTNPWEKLQSPVNSTLRNLSFTDSLTGWIAGENGVILHTSDGGISWELQNSTLQTFITSIFFSDDMNGWALSLKDVFPFNTIILKTNDGGNTWATEDFQDVNALMRTIFFFDPLNGFIGGSYIAYSSDGGNTWIQAEVDSNMVSSYPVYEFNFYNRHSGYACGGRKDVAGVIWRTTNDGLNWSAQGISSDEIFDVFVLDSLNAITLAGDPEGLFPIVNINTTNAGLNWTSENLPFFGLSFSIDFRTYNEGWSASGYKFLFTSDRGNTWNELETPDSSTIYDLQFTDARNGYAVGDNGLILKLDPSLVNVEDETRLPNDFILYQNYPNPFNPTTRIQYAISSGQFVTLKVYNILGKEVAILVNEEKPAGEYEFFFNAPGLPSGIYFYELEAGSFTETKKMILMK